MSGWGVGEPIDSFECVDCDWTWQKHGALNSLQLRRKHGMSDKDIMKAGLGASLRGTQKQESKPWTAANSSPKSFRPDNLICFAGNARKLAYFWERTAS